MSTFISGLDLSTGQAPGQAPAPVPAQVNAFVADFQSSLPALLGDDVVQVIVDTVGGYGMSQNTQIARRLQRQQRRRVSQATEVTFRVLVQSDGDETTVNIVDGIEALFNSGALDLSGPGYGDVSMDSMQVQDIETVAGNNVVHTLSIPAGVYYPSWSGDDITCYNDTDYP